MIDLTVADVMTSPVLTVAEDWPLDRLASFFLEHNVSGAPVTNPTGEVVGVVSMTDIVRHSSLHAQEGEDRGTHEYYLASAGRQFTYEEMQGYHIEPEGGVTARDLMTPMVFDIREDAPLQEVADMMVKGGIHRVLVTKTKKPTGIVTTLDMVKVIRDL